MDKTYWYLKVISITLLISLMAGLTGVGYYTDNQQMATWGQTGFASLVSWYLSKVMDGPDILPVTVVTPTLTNAYIEAKE